MFTIRDKQTFSWPISVRVPADGGTYAEENFNARFQVLGQDEINKEIDRPSGDASLIRRVVVGWDDVMDGDGCEIPFATAALERLIALPFVRVGLVQAYMEAMTGGGRARKN